ncbi:hypothetical protein [Kitasatospora griseola]|uniref:hypothetical protein n=1 Tax=Kitasatospora griseola TaxID=2064 RepID=UPI00365AF9D5
MTSTKHATYLRRTGVRATTTPDTAARHIHRLRAHGLRDPQIATAARIGIATVYRIARRHGPITRAVERRILEVPMPADAGIANCTATVAAVGTVRRLQALVVNGYPPAVIALRLGMPRQRLHDLLHGRHQRAAVHTAARVSHLYLEWWDQPAEQRVTSAAAERARTIATAHGWMPAAAWDDIDDPAVEPDLGGNVSRVQAVVEDTAELVLEGLSREGIAARLGIQWDAVRQAHRRAGVPLPAMYD